MKILSDLTKTVKCGYCGKFIGHKDLEKSRFHFVPDSDLSSEETYYICVKCNEKNES